MEEKLPKGILENLSPDEKSLVYYKKEVQPGGQTKMACYHRQENNVYR
ncbi:hypothetical protein OCC_13605 [Thermococcus litoralis DSM 5473]|uniref:Uncharacterized protein n=1 Tax=Thermococcus litoralis (strain ATCC 51850 / DSM 5473 / JCM 8560 / NS-C) TaxID=523849 RepID=S5ZAX2_THELN|nr:hypothetical protein OCC_13605 [Thermococcus litoralis DSM 5473]